MVQQKEVEAKRQEEINKEMEMREGAEEQEENSENDSVELGESSNM